ncbi:biotin/lipoate--protein ligase family protein [Caldovatus sp. SYSU G05006]|uniref:Biotin/lipoate--protein ligase family protein n=1 Tax=Caldovatus aquaticus TaxID=2865671 RepID=A0ABS7F8Z8_9PROT|nr:biotin/lipoate--protein ligase family protein [Caldovatus aquaticus]
MGDGLPDLPPLFGPVFALREGGDALARAVALAPEHGAGCFVWVRAYARVEAAVVLEPEQPLAAARPALLAAAAAMADALAALGPPQAEIALRWPATLVVNRGVVGAARLAAPPGAAETAVPAWLAVGVEVRRALPPGVEPGTDPGRTALEEEGFDEADTAELTAAWARHLMTGLNEWQERGFARLAGRYLGWLERDPAQAGAARRGLDSATGDLVLQRPDGALTRRSLRAAVAEGVA